MARRRGRALLAVAIVLAAVAICGCGGDDFENEPRPAVPVDVSVTLGDKAIVISPVEFGAGTANFTIVNLGETSETFAIDGPTVASSEQIPPGTTTVLSTEVVTGDYEASVEGAAAPSPFEVGPDNDSAQDELLLP